MCGQCVSISDGDCKTQNCKKDSYKILLNCLCQSTKLSDNQFVRKLLSVLTLVKLGVA
jgi:hypothetical protein